MKKLIPYSTPYSSILIIGLLFCTSLLWAQETKQATIKIIKNINGQTTLIDTTINLTPDASIDAILAQLGVNGSDKQEVDIDVDVHVGDLGKNTTKKEDITVQIIKGTDYSDHINNIISTIQNITNKNQHLMNIMPTNNSQDDRPFLGVMIKMDGEATKVDGLYIDDVVEGGAAQNAGMTSGDVLTHFNREKIEDFKHLGQLIKKQKFGDQIEVTFTRSGTTQKATTTLGKCEEMSCTTTSCFPNQSNCCANENSNKAFLGIYPNENEAVKGVKAGHIVPESAAAKAGLQTGDIITAFNSKSITNLEDLQDALKEEKIGNRITLVFKQDGQLKTGEADLTADLEQKTSSKNACANKQSCAKEKMMKYPEKMKFDNGNKAFLGVLLKEDVATTIHNGTETQTTNQAEVGVLVTDIVEKSAAEEAGLKSGDVITAINGITTHDLHTLISEIGKYGIGDIIEVAYLRAGQAQTTKATLKGNADHNMGQERKMHFEEFDDIDYLGRLKDLDLDIKFEDLGLKLEDLDIRFKGLDIKFEDLENAGVIIKNLKDLEDGEFSKILKELGIDSEQLEGELEILENNNIQELIEKSGGDKNTWLFMDKEGKLTRGAINEEMEWTGEKDGKNISYKVKVWITDLEEKDAELVDQQPILEEAMAAEKAHPLTVDELKFFPNPSNGQFEVTFNLPENGDAIVRVLDISGKEVFRNHLAAFSGNYRKQIDISDQAKGIYFLQISQNGKILNKKIVVQ